MSLNLPAPMKAVGTRFSAMPMISPIDPSHPKQALNGRGGDSSGGMLCKYKIADPMRVKLLTWSESMGCQHSVVDGCYQHVTVDTHNHHAGVRGQLGLRRNN
jgi:hypothetical protein